MLWALAEQLGDKDFVVFVGGPEYSHTLLVSPNLREEGGGGGGGGDRGLRGKLERSVMGGGGGGAGTN